MRALRRQQNRYLSLRALVHLQPTTQPRLWHHRFLVGIMWIIEGFGSLFDIAAAGSRTTTIVFAIISTFAGLALVTSPVWGAPSSCGGSSASRYSSSEG